MPHSFHTADLTITSLAWVLMPAATEQLLTLFINRVLNVGLLTQLCSHHAAVFHIDVGKANTIRIMHTWCCQGLTHAVLPCAEW